MAVPVVARDATQDEGFPDLTGARAVVTGGCGFVGTALCRRLLEAGGPRAGVRGLSLGFEEAPAGAHVTVVDDLSLGSEEALPNAGDNSLNLAVRDIRDPQLSETFEAVRPTHVFHLAAIHYIPACERDPAKAIDVNLRGTQCVLD